MGRPKGSLNKKTKTAIKRRRGRPKRIVKEVQVIDSSNVKQTKFLGYCPKCNFMISKSDLKSKRIFACPSCEKSGSIRALKNDKPKDAMTKKEYLENTLNVDFHDMPSFNREDHGNLKVQY